MASGGKQPFFEAESGGFGLWSASIELEHTRAEGVGIDSTGFQVEKHPKGVGPESQGQRPDAYADLKNSKIRLYFARNGQFTVAVGFERSEKPTVGTKRNSAS